ncbi:hypothetical protein DVS77_18480 [Mycolicibacterium moriokaense]|nr:hypothetical protein DVS77_18480 [Mycolicibacterium moriokaense]
MPAARSAPLPNTSATHGYSTPLRPASVDQIVPAGQAVRACSFLLDLAVMASPVLPLTAIGAILGVAEVVYLVVPVAFLAIWVWMQLWQGFTGMTFGKSVLGLRLVRASDQRAPGYAAASTRGLVFAVTVGLAALPAMLSDTPRDGAHDRLAGVTLIDVAVGANPLGLRQQPPLRRALNRGVRTVHSPVPLGATGQR